ncbi:MAG: EutN/CcmL family microcompartment protein [Anaerococcus hydrogenalis]|nr:EutN/CcmL family microcompartment protein [Anaerococcus hydrogenalis]
MVIAKLIGNVWATRKYDSLNGLKFMLVEILDGSEKNKKIGVVDTIGAGRGDTVIITQGSSARAILEENQNQKIPVDAVIVGIIDEDCDF